MKSWWRFLSGKGSIFVSMEGQYRGPVLSMVPLKRGLLSPELQGGVDPGHKALDRRLFIAGGAVELTGAVKPVDLPALQGGPQLGGIDAVVLNGIGAAGHLRLLQTGDGVQHLNLHVLRQGGGEALDVELLCVQPHGLHKELVPGLVRKAHDLGLDAGAVPGADPLNDAGDQGTPVQVGPDDGVGSLVGIGQIAHRPVLRRGLGGEGEGLRLRIPRLDLHFGEVHRPGVHPGRGAGLEAAHPEAQAPELFGQRQGGGQAVRALGAQHIAHHGPSVQIGPGGDDHGPAAVHGPIPGGDGDDSPVLHAYGHHLRLLQTQVFLPLQGLLHDLLIAPPVRLCPERVDGRPFAQVQHPVLDAGFVRGPGHLAAQSVQLPHQVALGGAADGGVAGHVAHAVQIDGKAHRVQPQPCRGQGRLDARVARADDGDVTVSRLIIHIGSPNACFSHYTALPGKKQERPANSIKPQHLGAEDEKNVKIEAFTLDHGE